MWLKYVMYNDISLSVNKISAKSEDKKILMISRFVTVQQVCAFTALTVRKHGLAGKNPIAEGNFRWIFARNCEGTEQLHGILFYIEERSCLEAAMPPVRIFFGYDLKREDHDRTDSCHAF